MHCQASAPCASLISHKQAHHARATSPYDSGRRVALQSPERPDFRRRGDNQRKEKSKLPHTYARDSRPDILHSECYSHRMLLSRLLREACTYKGNRTGADDGQCLLCDRWWGSHYQAEKLDNDGSRDGCLVPRVPSCLKAGVI